jgi:hypothetical protein
VLCLAANGPRLDERHPLPAPHAVEQLETLLQWRLRGRVRDFRLEVVGGGLVLRGQARTYYSKQLAQHAVMGATDVPIWANEIEVV